MIGNDAPRVIKAIELMEQVLNPEVKDDKKVLTYQADINRFILTDPVSVTVTKDIYEKSNVQVIVEAGLNNQLTPSYQISAILAE